MVMRQTPVYRVGLWRAVEAGGLTKIEKSDVNFS